ncbi:MAG: thioredoxin family protein [Phycisphaerales bacterium JB040]
MRDNGKRAGMSGRIGSACVLWAVVGVVGAVGGLSGCNAPPESTIVDRTPAQNARLAEGAGDAEIVIVAMHADWCATCRVLGPELDEAAARLGDQPITVVKADLTDRDNPEGKATLHALGLDDLYRRNNGKTGVLYLVDADTGAVVGVLGGRSDGEFIERTVRGAVAAGG